MARSGSGHDDRNLSVTTTMAPPRKKDSTCCDTPGASQRQLRVSELIRHALAEVLSQGNLHDAALTGHIITVPEVRMSPDLEASDGPRHAAGWP